MSIRCPNCGIDLANGWIGPCPKCGYRELRVPDFGKAYENVVRNVVGPSASGSIAVATTAVSTISGAYYDAKIRLESLGAMGVPRIHLERLESDINKLNEDKVIAENKVKELSGWTSKDREEFAEEVMKRLDRHSFLIRKDIELVGIKVNGTTDLIKKLSERAVTTEELKHIEDLIVRNQELVVYEFNQRVKELKDSLQKQLEGRIDPGEATGLWDILEKMSTLGGAVQFAEYAKKLLDFLIEHKILQSALPIILKIIFG